MPTLAESKPEKEAPNNPSASQEPPNAEPEDSEDSASPEIDRLRRQVESYKNKAVKAERDKERAKLGEVDRLKAEIEDLRRSAEESERKRVEFAVTERLRTLAHGAGAHDIDALLRLMDRSGVEIDDAGKVIGAERALKAAQKQFPWAFGTARSTPTGDSGGNPGASPAQSKQNQSVNDWIRRRAGF